VRAREETHVSAILALKPVTFHYKSDKSGTPQYGLIAEEVAEQAVCRKTRQVGKARFHPEVLVGHGQLSVMLRT